MIQRGENAWQDVKRGAAIMPRPFLIRYSYYV
jgi:hypothetical protein